MKLSNLDLNYVKKHLNVDHELDDLRLQSHIESVKAYIALSHGYDSTEELEENELLFDLAMVMIQDLYDNGKITTSKAISFMSIDRRF